MRGSGRPVWDDTLPPEDLAVLDPGASAWDPTPDVLVIGGGVIGLAVAASCTRAGMRVLLAERDRLANAASGRAAGGLSPDAHPELGAEWHTLARRSLALHHELDAQWSYGLRTLDLLIPPDFRIPAQAHVHPLRLAAAFARRAGRVATGVNVGHWDVERDRVVRVRTTNGDVVPSFVVVATGTAAERSDTRERWVKGHLIATEPADAALDEIVADGEILVVQLPDKRLVAGGTKDVADESAEVRGDVVSGIEAKLGDLVPAARGVRTTHTWTCFRPCTADELPAVDRVDGLSNAWVACGLYSTGLLMAPVVGSIVAEWIGGARPAGIEVFETSRLRP